MNPAMAVARLGSSSVPQDAFVWADALHPRDGDSTRLLPQWTLEVQPDGSVLPRMPDTLQFRDGDQIRPVCPYFELHALMGEPGSDRASWVARPLTPDLLQAAGTTPAALVLTVDAANAKAARRCNNPLLRFGTFPPLSIPANVLRPVQVNGVSPPGANPPMIPAGRHIALGRVRWVRSKPQPAAGTTPWADAVNVEILRFRYTPPGGQFYGPPAAAQLRLPQLGRPQFAAVQASRAFLDAAAGWTGVLSRGIDAPSDTYDTDGTNPERGNPLEASLGVVDDTSDARLTVSLTLPDGRLLRAGAHLFVSPPDFAPDRRPFLSLADEINDRAGDAARRSEAMSPAALDDWIEDLFERVYETVSLFNVDHWRALNATELGPAELRDSIKDDGYGDGRAMGGSDALRAADTPIAAASRLDPLPMSEHARARHRMLADIVELKNFVQAQPDRLKALIRPPFQLAAGEFSDVSLPITTMRMPPFMRNSNAQALTLAAWQYDLIMSWLATVTNDGSAAARARMGTVLARLDARGGR